jgi:hypothetical protein
MIISAGKRIHFVRDRISYTVILRARWCDIMVLVAVVVVVVVVVVE